MNYFEILNFKNIGGYSFSNIEDYNTFIFNNIEKPTEAQISAWTIEYKKQLCKDEAKRLIQVTDWSVLPDVALQNKSEFEAYRKELRELILNPVETPEWPTEPQSVWR